MPYVMVPVPEEHVEEVMQFVLRAIARASIEEWDAESVAEMFASIDEPSRSLLSFAARAVAAGKDITEADAAAMMQLSSREVAGIMRELNELAREGNRPTLVGNRVVMETLPNGRTREKRVLVMADELAALVREAERADMVNEPQTSVSRGA
jgi:hypothetical protein